ncbi:MAG: hypothetical protein ACF8GE_01710 [Phycisphaerales bacterium JB043]
MPRIARTLALLTLAALTLHASTASRAQDDGAHTYDLTTVQSTIDALYDVISGPAGHPRDWDAFRSLFAQDAHLRTIALTQDGKPSLRTMSVEDYIQGAGGFFESNAFFESELLSTSDSFGHIAHVFSTYEARRSPDDEPFTRGINSIQLYTDGTRWYIVSILWDTERAAQPIPEDYLPS